MYDHCIRSTRRGLCISNAVFSPSGCRQILSLAIFLPQALTSAKATISSLAQQQRDLELRRRANLAFSGQTLVGDNLNVLQVRKSQL